MIHNNFQMIEAIKLEHSLGRGKAKLDFDLTQLYFTERFPEI